MAKEKKWILQVRGNKNKQKRVTIPSNSEINEGDYVEVRKVNEK